MARASALFLSHGSPMMALETPGSDPYVAALAELGRSMPRPRAICLVSAHWHARGRYVSESVHPETIYDFSGFPEELSRVRYDCPGYPEGAAMLDEVAPDLGYRAVERGIDHGGWTVLRHLYPDADVPVFSVSLDATASMADHLELGRRLGPLRDEWILILGTGNIAHDLGRVAWSDEWSDRGFPDIEAFDRAVEAAVDAGDTATLLSPWSLPGGRSAVPTPEHYLPFVVAYGAGRADEKPAWIWRGYEYGSISRRAMAWR